MNYGLAVSVALWALIQTQSALATEPTEAVVEPVLTQTNAAPSPPTVPIDVTTLFEQARRDYDVGDLPGALDKLRRCYAIHASPNLAYDIAVLYRDLADCPKALEYFQQYVQEAPNGKRHAEAEQEIARLSKQCPTQISRPQPTNTLAAESTTVAPSVPAKPSPIATVVGTSAAPHPSAAFGWIAIGAGTLAGATAVYFTASAIQADHRTRARPISAEYYEENASALTRDSTYAWVFGVTSLVALGIGTYVLIASPTKPRPTAAFLATSFSTAGIAGYRLGF